MRSVVSISLGSPERDWSADLSSLGVPLRIERRGVGLDYGAYLQALRRANDDPDVAAVGLGGINRYLFSGRRAYPLARAEQMAAQVTRKPLCDGAAMKRHWEPHVVRTLAAEGTVDFRDTPTLMVCAVDRWGMAAALEAAGARLILGDLMFALGVPCPLRSLAWTERLTRVVLPVVTRWVPFEWLYPTGETPPRPRYGNWYAWARILAGDFKFIARHLPEGEESLAGKVILTNTTTPRDVERLRKLGASLLVTTTASLGGRSFGTNAVEAAACALAGRHPDEMDLPAFHEVFAQLGWDQPRVERLA